MRWLLLLAVSAASTFAQVQAPNAAGVSMGHFQLRMRDAKAQIKVWTDVFAPQIGNAGPMELLKLPGIFVIVALGAPEGGTDGSTVNHVGFTVKDYAATKGKLEAAMVPIEEVTPNQQMYATFPEGVKVEIVEDKNLATPVAFNHFHLSVSNPETARAWYVKHFGATSTTRHNTPAAALPGGELVFVKADKPQGQTKGRPLDHIGFEVKSLQAFCKTLATEGVHFDFEFHDLDRFGLKVAFLTDPDGTSIELTEGLAAK